MQDVHHGLRGGPQAGEKSRQPGVADRRLPTRMVLQHDRRALPLDRGRGEVSSTLLSNFILSQFLSHPNDCSARLGLQPILPRLGRSVGLLRGQHRGGSNIRLHSRSLRTSAGPHSLQQRRLLRLHSDRPVHRLLVLRAREVRGRYVLRQLFQHHLHHW